MTAAGTICVALMGMFLVHVLGGSGLTSFLWFGSVGIVASTIKRTILVAASMIMIAPSTEQLIEVGVFIN